MPREWIKSSLGSGEYLILVSSEYVTAPNEEYSKRWGIETLFGALKSRGFNLEDTRLQDPERVSRLLALLALAFTWAFVVGEWQAAVKELKLKKHGYPPKSVFRLGLNILCRLVTHLERFDLADWRRFIKLFPVVRSSSLDRPHKQSSAYRKERAMGEQSGWQLTGSGPEAYERYIVPAFMATSQELVALAALQRGERVLDVACGTGIVARLAAQVVGATGRIVGTDVNEAMLGMARTVPRQHDGPPVEWRQSDAAALPFPDASFDVVFCQYGLEFFADQAAGLRQIKRVLVPGGRLVLRVWRALERQPFYVALLEALDRHVRAGVGAPILKAFTLADAAALRALLARAGFRRVHIRLTTNLLRYPSVEEYVLGYLPVFLSVASDVAAMMDDTRRTAVLKHVTTALRADVDDDGLATPTESHVVVACT